MDVDATIKEEARETSRHGETAGAGAEIQVPQQTPTNQTGPLERTLTLTTPAVMCIEEQEVKNLRADVQLDKDCLCSKKKGYIYLRISRSE